MNRQYTVFLIYTQAFVRSALRVALEIADDIRVIGDSASGVNALRQIRLLKPDLVLCDTQLEGFSGIELASRISRTQRQTKVLIFSNTCDGNIPARVMEAGASGYLHTGCSTEELQTAIRHVARGELYLSRSVAQALALHRPHDLSPLESLSPRELEVALMLAQGYRPQEIANNLSLSVKTVSTHKSRIFNKLELTNIPKLVALLHRFGYDLVPV